MKFSFQHSMPEHWTAQTVEQLVGQTTVINTTDGDRVQANVTGARLNTETGIVTIDCDTEGDIPVAAQAPITGMSIELPTQGDMEYVRGKAGEVWTAEGVDIWMDWPNKMLDGRTPTECVEQGDTAKVLALIEALNDGAFM